MNILYVVPNLEKVSGGPSTRISLFSQVFKFHGDIVISGNKKFSKSFSVKRIDFVYVESATNRIYLIDFFNLLYFRLVSKKIIVFIRDIYSELFPEEYKSPRSRITLMANRVSYFFLTAVAHRLVFPTEKMGTIFFEKNRYFPKKPYSALPPGCAPLPYARNSPDFSKKAGVLYLGSVSYANAGFEHFLTFADCFESDYNYYVLSSDVNVQKMISGRKHIFINKVPHNEIPSFIETRNILVAFHTRPRNAYDDITFPIKVLDFVSFQLPFITDRHPPLIELLGEDYPLFINISDSEGINEKIRNLLNGEANFKIMNFLGEIALKNTYEERYRQLFQ